ncbi:MAG TPA: YIP1 family protein, partial [Chthonomonadaceae bacterium]|nr:YIP1 family protein [Chthonomonadaceae bacterium]
VQLEPANAQARYNLGIALERAGWREQAITALQQALQLQPDYARAREALDSLQGQGGMPAPAAPAPSNGASSSDTTTQLPGTSAQPMTGAPAYSPPAGSGATSLNAPAAGPQALTQHQPLSGPQPLAGPQPLTGGTQPLTGRPTAPPSGSPAASLGGYPPPGGAPTQPLAGGQAGYRLPPAYGPPGYAPGAYPGGAPYTERLYEPDGFDLLQGFNDLWRVLISPQKFFQGQVGREGLYAPMSMLLACVLVNSLGNLLHGIISPASIPGLAMLGGGGGLNLIRVIGILIAIPFQFVFLLVWLFILAGIVHVIGLLFGNRASFAGSFRVVTYAGASFPVILFLLNLVSPLLAPPRTAYALPASAPRVILAQYNPNRPGSPYGHKGSSTPRFPRSRQNLQTPSVDTTNLQFLLWTFSIGTIWCVVLTGIGARHIQQISNVGAVITAILGAGLPYGLLIAGLAMLTFMVNNITAGAMRH